MRNIMHISGVVMCGLVASACCTTDITTPPRVDGVNVSLEGAVAGHYNSLTRLSGCELCDEDKELARSIEDEARPILSAFEDGTIDQKRYNEHVERIQTSLREVKRICNTPAISDAARNQPGNLNKYAQSEKNRDIREALKTALEQTRAEKEAALQP